MNVTAKQTAPNTHQMVVIHRIFRREFPLLAGVVPRASDGDARRFAHIDFCVSSPHNDHRRGRVLWPTLLGRAQPHAQLVHGLEVQQAERSRTAP